MTRAFGDDLMAALAQPVTNLVLCVRIVRLDGTRILFAQASEELTTIDETGAPQIFLQARGVSLATIPFELNGSATRADLNIISTDGGTIDVADIENGLYDNSAVTISVASLAVPGPPSFATGSITFSSNPANTSIITLHTDYLLGFDIQFDNVANGINSVQIGVDLATTMANLLNVFNFYPGGLVHDATYTVNSNTLFIKYAVAGAAGNAFTLFATPASHGTVSGPTLTGGADGSPPPGQSIIFDGLMGTMTLTERGHATIEIVGHLERAKQFVTEVYTPVCRADFGDARCKVNLNGNDALGNPITQRCKIVGYDGGYKITVSGLNATSLGAVGARAKGKITFYANPPISGGFGGVYGPSIGLNGVVLYLWELTTPTDRAYGAVATSVIASTLEGTLFNLLNFLTHSKDPTLALMAYNVDRTTLYVTAAAEGLAGNAFKIVAGPNTPATASGPTLTGGFGLGNYFLNGQVIFRSGLLLNEAYEIQASEGNLISLFTPLEFPPGYGDIVDILQGCDHSPFVGGCARFPDPATGRAPNINNYRGEPWAPGDAINPCQAVPSSLPITGIPRPIGGGGGGGGPQTEDEPQGLWADFIDLTFG